MDSLSFIAPKATPNTMMVMSEPGNILLNCLWFILVLMHIITQLFWSSSRLLIINFCTLCCTTWPLLWLWVGITVSVFPGNSIVIRNFIFQANCWTALEELQPVPRRGHVPFKTRSFAGLGCWGTQSPRGKVRPTGTVKTRGGSSANVQHCFHLLSGLRLRCTPYKR